MASRESLVIRLTYSQLKEVAGELKSVVFYFSDPRTSLQRHKPVSPLANKELQRANQTRVDLHMRGIYTFTERRIGVVASQTKGVSHAQARPA